MKPSSGNSRTWSSSSPASQPSGCATGVTKMAVDSILPDLCLLMPQEPMHGSGQPCAPDTSNGSLQARYRLSSRISPTGRSWLLILWNKSHGSLEGGRNTAKPATAAGIGPTKCIRHRKVLRVLRAQCRTGVH